MLLFRDSEEISPNRLTARRQIYPINSNCHDSDMQFPSSGHKLAVTHIEFSLLGFARHFIVEIKQANFALNLALFARRPARE
jgi:hypothetical protein